MVYGFIPGQGITKLWYAPPNSISKLIICNRVRFYGDGELPEKQLTFRRGRNHLLDLLTLQPFHTFYELVYLGNKWFAVAQTLKTEKIKNLPTSKETREKPK